MRVAWTGGRIGALLSLALLEAAAAASSPPPTPTPRPRLSGGFGSPRHTVTPSSASGQSLQDVVRAAGESRGKKPAAGKSAVTISNQTLVTDPQKGRVSTSSAAAPPQTPASRPLTADPAAPEAPRAEPPGAPSEAEWRTAARGARQRVASLKERVPQLAGEAVKLESDFYTWDDGQYRDSVIKPAWDSKLQELEAAKKELTAAEKELADLPERARKAGALPGWLRE